jgi:hypothetical protein
MLRKANMSHFGSAFSRARAGILAVLAAVPMAVALAGCAQQQGQHEAQASAAQPLPAYCEASPAPDCEFKGSKARTVDSAEFDRLKGAYERRCIRHAEKAERERMRELQAAGACAGRPAPSLAASR